MAILKQSGLGYGTYYSNQPAGTGNKIKRFLLVGVIAAAVIGVGLFGLTLLSGNSKNDMTLLAVRENSLLVLATSSEKNIRHPDLSTANSNAMLLLTSDVASIISDTGIKKLPDDLVKREVDTNTERLAQANLLNKFDSTYRQVVLEKIGVLIPQAQTVKNSVSTKKSRELLDKVIVNLQSIQKQFTDVAL